MTGNDSFTMFRGFTKFSRNDYLKYKSENRIVPDGVNAKVCLTSNLTTFSHGGVFHL